MVSPLANLNFNVSNYFCSNNLFEFIMEFVPDFIRFKINYTPPEAHLIVQSLNVSTAYVRPYLTYGFSGMYILFITEILLCSIVILIAYTKNKKYFITITNCLFYALTFMFFDNTLTYTTSSMLFVYSLICCLGIKFKIRK